MMFRIDNPQEVSDISLDSVNYSLLVNDVEYTEGDSVTLGSEMQVQFNSIADLKDFHINNCLANNEETAGSEGYFEVQLVDNGCVPDSSTDPLKTIVPTLTDNDKTLNFNQFGFISKFESGEVELKFQLICVLSFGSAPDCTSAASRRQYTEKETKNYQLSKLEFLETFFKGF